VYRLEVSHTVYRQIKRLPLQAQERIVSAITHLTENPRPPGTKKLTGREGYRVRVGDYRILYQIDDAAKVITIFRVMSRGDVYRA